MNAKLGYVAPLVAGILLAIGSAHAEDRAMPPSDAAYELSIRVGRLGVILDRAEELSETMAGTSVTQDAGDSHTEAKDVFRDLQEAVLRYDLYVVGACSMGQKDNALCRPLYLPAWLNDPPGTIYSDVELGGMVKQSADKIEALWLTVCAKGQAVSNDKTMCNLE